MNEPLTQITLPMGRWPTPPSQPGWYVCYSGATTPRLMYWGTCSKVFRENAREIPVDSYAGPIPVRK